MSFSQNTLHFQMVESTDKNPIERQGCPDLPYNKAAERDASQSEGEGHPELSELLTLRERNTVKPSRQMEATSPAPL